LDEACERAVESVSAVPPPPEKFKHLFAAGMVLDCQPK
jgi:hypothetical protein